MKKMTMMLSALLAACVLLGSAFAQDSQNQLSFDSNPSTGYEWSAFVLSGDAVEVSDGVFIPDEDASPEIVGAGGQTVFTLQGVQPGFSLIHFVYSRPWERDSAEQHVCLIYVDEQLQVQVTDITEAGVIEGVAVSVDEGEHSVLVHSDRLGDVIALFAEDMALPVQDEAVVLYTDGKMTMSLPGIVNVLAWESVPSEQARAAETCHFGELTGLTDFAALITEENPIISAYYENGSEMHISFVLEDAAELQELFALVEQLEIESVSDMMVTDSYPVLRFTALNGEVLSISFNGRWLSKDRTNYNLSNDAPLWKRISQLEDSYAEKD